MVGTLERNMARKVGRPKGDRNDVSVKLDAALVNQARLIAVHRNVALNELLSEMLRGPIEKAGAQMLRDLNKAAEAKGGAE